MGKRQRIENRPQAMLEARDLPHCNLSRLLEERLNSALQQEQVERAKEQVYLPAHPYLCWSNTTCLVYVAIVFLVAL